jgi:hypothetical protein
MSDPVSVLTVGAVIARLLPYGSEYDLVEGRLVPPKPARNATRRWEVVPTWPPDLCAVVATLIDLSSSYSHVTATDWSAQPDDLRRLGREWNGSQDEVEGGAGPTADKWFSELDQRWLDASRGGLQGFLLGLLAEARKEVLEVHGLVLPELALDRKLAEGIARALATQEDLEFFVTGVHLREAGGRSRNHAFCCYFEESRANGSRRRQRTPVPWQQSKHHRWKLDRSQIGRYHLGHALDPQYARWESIRLDDRRITLFEVRRGASLAVLICEDLARIDPVQPIVRAIGPNLVVALLMDGPQLERRWPGRYATVLADDPGSAVLTLTSLGMVLRSTAPADVANRSVALWKDGTGDARALQLRSGAHALLLTLSPEAAEERTLDRRSDEKTTVQFSLSGVRDVVHPAPEDWART